MGGAAGKVLAGVFCDDMKTPKGRGHSVSSLAPAQHPQTGGTLQWGPIPAQDLLSVPGDRRQSWCHFSQLCSVPTPGVRAGHWAQGQTTEAWLCLSGLALQVWLPRTPTDRRTDGRTDGQCPMTNDAQ